MSLECPYCEKDQEDFDGVDYHETGVIYNYTCQFCEKVFGFEVEYDPVYYARELPCGNGADHDWCVYAGHCYKYRICKHCDKRENIKEEE